VTGGWGAGREVWQREGGGSMAVCRGSSAETSRTVCLPSRRQKPHIERQCRSYRCENLRFRVHVTWRGRGQFAPGVTRSGTETQQLIANCMHQSWLTPNTADQYYCTVFFALNEHCAACFSLDYQVPLCNVSFCSWVRASRHV